MSKENVSQIGWHFERLFTSNARTYARMFADHLEQLLQLQVAASRTYIDIGFKQYRAALEVRTPDDLEAYVEDQQKIAKELGELVRGDTEKVVSLHQEFAEKAQKVTEDTGESATKSGARSTK